MTSDLVGALKCSVDRNIVYQYRHYTREGIAEDISLTFEWFLKREIKKIEKERA